MKATKVKKTAKKTTKTVSKKTAPKKGPKRVKASAQPISVDGVVIVSPAEEKVETALEKGSGVPIIQTNKSSN